jgi:hypothetical protein
MWQPVLQWKKYHVQCTNRTDKIIIIIIIINIIINNLCSESVWSKRRVVWV